MRVKPKKEENQPGDSVLDADHLVIGRENILSPKTELMMFMLRVCMRIVGDVADRRRSVHREQSRA